jgi:hypothetical protein
MDVVIQCAAGKDEVAGRFRTHNGRAVYFVANPELCKNTTEVMYARPDDRSDDPGLSWRDRLVQYEKTSRKDNAFHLPEAYLLYKHKAYRDLVRRFGCEHVFILSAGWGLIRADYLTPPYDITFNKRAKQQNPPAFCNSTVGYEYFQQIPRGGTGPIVFLGGRDYHILFSELTAPLNRGRIVYIRAGESNSTWRATPKFEFDWRPFRVAALTNWHYQCADALATGKLTI